MEGAAAQLPYSVPISSLPGRQAQRGTQIPRIMQSAVRTMRPAAQEHFQAEEEVAFPPKQQQLQQHLQQQAVSMAPEWADSVTFTRPSSKTTTIPPLYNPWYWQAQAPIPMDPGMITPWMLPASPGTLAGLMPETPFSSPVSQPPVTPGSSSGGAGSHSPPQGAPAPAAAAANSSMGARGSAGGSQGRRRGRTNRGKREAGWDSPPSPDTRMQGSAILNEVRKNGTECALTIREALPHLAELARDPAGAKFLEKRLEGASMQDRALALECLLPEIIALSNEAHGSLVVQKLLQIGTPEQRKAIALKLQAEALRLSNKMYGCRVMQKAFQVCAPDVQLLLASDIKRGVLECIKSMHGNYVIQMCIEQMPPDSVSFVVDAIEERAELTAAHVYGCRIIQRLLEHCSPARLDTMLNRILGNVLRLSGDAYGNYVIRHILDHGRKEHKQRILEAIRSNITELSLDKCASNVVEKCIEASTTGEHAHALSAEREKLIRGILGEAGDPNPPVARLLDDRFGKYVVQCVIENSRQEEKELLRERLVAAGPRVRKNVSNCVAHLATLNRQLQSPAGAQLQGQASA